MLIRCTPVLPSTPEMKNNIHTCIVEHSPAPDYPRWHPGHEDEGAVQEYVPEALEQEQRREVHPERKWLMKLERRNPHFDLLPLPLPHMHTTPVRNCSNDDDGPEGGLHELIGEHDRGGDGVVHRVWIHIYVVHQAVGRRIPKEPRVAGDVAPVGKGVPAWPPMNVREFRTQVEEPRVTMSWPLTLSMQTAVR